MQGAAKGDSPLTSLRDAHEQMLALLAAHGLDESAAELLAPVLRGEQTLEQNRDMLLEMLARVEE